ncbi:hypothetical protein J6590_101414, partial [Homalodisca vitripennis]
SHLQVMHSGRQLSISDISFKSSSGKVTALLQLNLETFHLHLTATRKFLPPECIHMAPSTSSRLPDQPYLANDVIFNKKS